MIRRICLYGGPGVGKTVEAAKIFAGMKIQHQKIELVQEWGLCLPQAAAGRGQGSAQ